MLAHAKLSASGSHRWLACPGSVKAEDGIADSGSHFAAEGTAAHALAEHCLNNNLSADTQIGETFEGFEVDNYMAEYVQQYISYVKSFSGLHLYEKRVDFSPWVSGGFGTCDALIIQDDGVLRVIDLKYGKGLRVDAENNTQAMLYALGALEDYGFVYDIQTIEIAIVQPRLDHIDEWVISVDDLLAFGEDVKRKAELCLTDDAPRNPGEKQCQWCKAKAKCPALKAYTEQTIMVMFEDVTPASTANPETLTDEQLTEILNAKKLIEGWLSAVEQHVIGKLETGEPFKGYKLVEGRSVRQWVNESEAEKVLSAEYAEDKLYSRKFISVAQAEKLLGKRNLSKLEGLTVKPQGKPTLAPEDDKRSAINLTSDDFDAC